MLRLTLSQLKLIKVTREGVETYVK
jgi:hypothetical protein